MEVNLLDTEEPPKSQAKNTTTDFFSFDLNQSNPKQPPSNVFDFNFQQEKP